MLISRRQFLSTTLSGLSLAKSGSLGASTAAAQGFKVPGQSRRHERTFMQWPVNRDIHTDRIFLDMLQGSIAQIANTVAEVEPVVMLMDAQFEKAARRKLGKKIEIWDIPTDDLWCRDSGPLFIVNHRRELATVDFNFNGWGNKQPHAHDGRIAKRVSNRLGVPLIDSGLVGEAGGIEADGDGTLLAHESSWINANRNAQPKALIENRLMAALGATKVIWAPGIKGADITDYHIDSLARFVRPGLVAIQLPEKPVVNDPWSVAAFQTYEILRNARDAEGRPLQIVKLKDPVSPRVRSTDFVASYVNYYVCNGAVIAAQFGDQKADAEAKSILARLYPGREVITLNVDPIGECGGGIHCATKQQPIP